MNAHYLGNTDELFHHFGAILDLGWRQDHGANPGRNKVEVSNTRLERS